jgi:hypothetical protein
MTSDTKSMNILTYVFLSDYERDSLRNKHIILFPKKQNSSEDVMYTISNIVVEEQPSSMVLHQ